MNSSDKKILHNLLWLLFYLMNNENQIMSKQITYIEATLTSFFCCCCCYIWYHDSYHSNLYFQICGWNLWVSAVFCSLSQKVESRYLKVRVLKKTHALAGWHQKYFFIWLSIAQRDKFNASVVNVLWNEKWNAAWLPKKIKKCENDCVNDISKRTSRNLNDGKN